MRLNAAGIVVLAALLTLTLLTFAGGAWLRWQLPNLLRPWGGL
jgi:hypothetical protein